MWKVQTSITLVARRRKWDSPVCAVGGFASAEFISSYSQSESMQQAKNNPMSAIRANTNLVDSATVSKFNRT